MWRRLRSLPRFAPATGGSDAAALFVAGHFRARHLRVAGSPAPESRPEKRMDPDEFVDGASSWPLFDRFIRPPSSHTARPDRRNQFGPCLLCAAMRQQTQTLARRLTEMSSAVLPDPA